MRPFSRNLTRALGAALLAAVVTLPVHPSSNVVAASGDADITEIDTAKRGKAHVLVRAEVGDSGLICQLKIKYTDGNADTPDDVISNSKGICEMYFDVPNRRSVVGEAVAKLTVLNKKGKDVAKTSRWFTVRDRRG
jgi:hypothetical protein